MKVTKLKPHFRRNAGPMYKPSVGMEPVTNRYRIMQMCNWPFQKMTYDWDDVELTWDHIFRKLTVQPEEISVLMTENILTPRKDREKTTQIMFEKFNIPSFYLENKCVLSLYAAGRTTGLCLKSGHTMTQGCAVYEGYALKESAFKAEFGGKDVEDELQRKRVLRDVYISSYLQERKALRKIKERVGFIKLDSKVEPVKQINIADHRTIEVRNERFECFEPLFDCERHALGVLLNGSINKCDDDLKRDLINNIVLSGGNTLTPGFVEKLHKNLKNGGELQKYVHRKTHLFDGFIRRYGNGKIYGDILKIARDYCDVDVSLKPLPEWAKVRINAAAERKYHSYIGGSILASLPSFGEMCITKHEYDELGPSIVHRKCF